MAKMKYRESYTANLILSIKKKNNYMLENPMKLSQMICTDSSTSWVPAVPPEIPVKSLVKYGSPNTVSNDI